MVASEGRMSRSQRNSVCRLVAALAILSLAAVARADDDAKADKPDAPAEPAADYDAFMGQNLDTCVGPADAKLKAPMAYDLGGFHYSIEGATLRVSRTSKRKGDGIRFGIL